MDQKKVKKELKTQFSYNRLWKLLIDRSIQKQELQQMSEVSAASIAKMGRSENVTTDVLLRICEAYTESRGLMPERSQTASRPASSSSTVSMK